MYAYKNIKNLSKIHDMFFSNRNLINSEWLNIKFNEQVTSFLESGNFLGVAIDTKLNFSFHIENICINSSKAIGLFKKK